MKHRRLFSGMLLLALLVTGCATMGAGKPNPELAAQYTAEAQKLEQQEDLPGALEKYKLALTADPENTTAKENSELLSQKLSKLADERYNIGMKYYAQGKYGLARNEFLAALKFQPDHNQASKMLSPQQAEAKSNYVFHLVKPGESLSMIAKQYYGDYKKFDVIAKFNNLQDPTMVKPGQRIMVPELGGKTVMPSIETTPDAESSYIIHTLRPGESISRIAQIYYGDKLQFHIIAQFNAMEDATRVSAGQKIKVPKIAGLPFHTVAPDAEPSQKEKPAVSKATTATDKSMATGNGTSEEQNGADEQVLAYRDAGIELFNDGKYNDAIFELNKAVEALPNDEKARRYLARAYFESGKQLYEKQDYKAAVEAFESSRQYDPKCEKCSTYIKQSTENFKETHYNKGIVYYGKQQLPEAITEWEMIEDIDPNYKELEKYLKQARKNFEKLKGIKAGRQ